MKTLNMVQMADIEGGDSCETTLKVTVLSCAFASVSGLTITRLYGQPIGRRAIALARRLLDSEDALHRVVGTADNCGCFGTKFASTPAATIAKNKALLAIVTFLRTQITDVGSVATASA